MDFEDLVEDIEECGVTVLPALLLVVVRAAKEKGSFVDDAAMIDFVDKYLVRLANDDALPAPELDGKMS